MSSIEVKKAVKGGIYISITKYTFVILNTIVTLLIVGTLGTVFYGVIGIIQGIFAISILPQYIIGIPLAREISASKLEKSRYADLISSSWLLSLLMSLFSIFLFEFIFEFQIRPKIIGVVSNNTISLINYAVAISIFVNFLNIIQYSILYGKMDYQRVIGFDFISMGGFIIIYLILIVTNLLNIFSYFIGFLIVNIAKALYSLRVVIKEIWRYNIQLFKDYSFATFKLLLKSVFHYGTATILRYLFVNMDAIILPNFLEYNEIGLYYFAKRIANKISMGGSTLKSFFLPLYTEVLTNNETKAKKYLSLSIKGTIFIVAPLVMVITIFSKEYLLFLALLLSSLKDFVDAYLILSIFLLAIFIWLIALDVSAFVGGKRKFYIVAEVNAISLIAYILVITIGFYVGVNLFFVSLAYFFGELARTLTWYVYLYKVEHTSVSIKIISLVEIINFIVFLVYRFLVDVYHIDLLIKLIGSIIVLAPVYVMNIKFGFFSKKEIEAIKRLVRKRKGLSKILSLFI